MAFLRNIASIVNPAKRYRSVEEKIAIVLQNSDASLNHREDVRQFISTVLHLPFVKIMETPGSMHFYIENNEFKSVPITADTHNKDAALRRINLINKRLTNKRNVLIEKSGMLGFEGAVYLYAISKGYNDDMCFNVRMAIKSDNQFRMPRAKI